jgi:hypothetical protein
MKFIFDINALKRSKKNNLKLKKFIKLKKYGLS